MPLLDSAKRVVLGRPVESHRLGETLLPKRLALPIFSSDPLSSVAYATQEILVILALAGTAYLYLTPWLAGGVVLLLVAVVASYRQLVRAYPSGGGDYEVASKNFGRNAALVVASALLVDYVLTVAVSISSGVDNIISAAPGLDPWRIELAVGFVVLLMALNLRGLRESGSIFAIPTYGFVVGILFMIVTGLVKTALGDPPVAASASYDIVPAEGASPVGLALVFVALRAFASGCTALTGVEAIANGVPAFKPPKSKNAATTLLTMGLLAGAMFMGITALAVISKVHVADDPCDLVGFDCSQPQLTVVAQVSAAVFSGTGSVGFFYVQAMTAAILVLAANTAFNGFPLLGSILAQDRFLPRQLHTRGDRLAFSNGILLLSAMAVLLIVAFQADVTRLIQLYIVGVFTAFTFGQSGMVRHWTRLLATERDPEQRAQYRRSRLINGFGASLTALVLMIVTVTKFSHGAWIVLVAMPILFLGMKAIERHYRRVSAELVAEEGERPILPARVHAVVLVSQLHKPTLRALSYAHATRPDSEVAVTVNVDDADTRALQEAWDRANIQMALLVLESPYREVTRPVLEYVGRIRRESPRDLVIVYVPEYVVGHWWETLLHNQSALRLKTRLRLSKGVMVTSVPYQLASSARVSGRGDEWGPGFTRRGVAEGAAADEAAESTAAPEPPR